MAEVGAAEVEGEVEGEVGSKNGKENRLFGYQISRGMNLHHHPRLFLLTTCSDVYSHVVKT